MVWGGEARFYNPAGIAVDGAGRIFVADSLECKHPKHYSCRNQLGGGYDRWNDRIPRKTLMAPIAPRGFFQPGGVTVDKAGNIYVADTRNCTIRKNHSDWNQLGGNKHSPDRFNTTAMLTELTRLLGFSGPCGVAVDTNNCVYVADIGNGRTRKITPHRVELGGKHNRGGVALSAGRHRCQR